MDLGALSKSFVYHVPVHVEQTQMGDKGIPTYFLMFSEARMCELQVLQLQGILGLPTAVNLPTPAKMRPLHTCCMLPATL